MIGKKKDPSFIPELGQLVREPRIKELFESMYEKALSDIESSNDKQAEEAVQTFKVIRRLRNLAYYYAEKVKED